VVAEVAPEGSAAGVLEPGDRLIAIDGDSAVALIGPSWILRDRPDKDGYTLTVMRGDRTLVQPLDWPVIRRGRLTAWLWVHLATGAIYYLVGLMIAFAKPESLSARRAALSAVLSSAFFTSTVFDPDLGTIGGPLLLLAMVAFFVRPYHLLAGFLFTASFPLEERSTGGWRRFELVIYAATFVVWVPSVYGAVLRALGPERAVPIAAAQYPFSLLHDTLVPASVVLLAAVLSIAQALVCLRNYRAVTDPDLKRRLRWVSIGIGVGMIPIFVMAPALLLAYASGKRLDVDTIVRVINTITVIIPLCIGYAVLKHRVLGVRVVLRAGLRYLLARNVLRVALLLPLALIAWQVVTNPGATVADLLLGPAGRVNLLLGAAAALALAFRRPLLQGIDRRFFREAYQQDRIFLALAEAIGRAADDTEISRLLSSQIQSALHPQSIVVIAAEEHDEFALLYSSSGRGASRSLSTLGLAPSEFEHLAGSTDLAAIGSLRDASRAQLEALVISLIVPIRGTHEGLVGLILLGNRMSEEPYSRNDRRLLDTIASQTGVVWENLRLRERLKREQSVRRDVISQMAGSDASMLMECPACGCCYESTESVCTADGRALTPSMSVPRTLDGKYRLDRVIGRGGMGAVFAGTDLRLDRIVAVKVTTDEMLSDSVALERFAREARASARLDHPNVVRAFDVGGLGNGAYLVLEFLKGGTLRRELQRRGALSLREAGGILSQAIAGTTAAHARHIVHRDIKPENIFLAEVEGSDVRVTKLLDFGLAVVRDLGFADRARLTQTGSTVGTLSYMSAEQFLGERVDERADIYALGVVALEMLTGELDSRGPTFGRIEALVDERLAGPGAPAVARPRPAGVTRAPAHDPGHP
jgi:hypothetical protein